MSKGARNRRIRMQAARLIAGTDHRRHPNSHKEFPGIENAHLKTVVRKIRRVGWIAGTRIKVW